MVPRPDLRKQVPEELVSYIPENAYPGDLEKLSGQGLNYPEKLNPLFSEGCKIYRSFFNEKVRRHMQSMLTVARDKSNQKAINFFETVGSYGNLLRPFPDVLEQLDTVVELIGITGTLEIKDDKKIKFLFIERDIPETQEKYGTGKTSILNTIGNLQIPDVNLTMPETEFDSYEDALLFFEKELPILTVSYGNPNLKRVASDMNHFSTIDGQLAMATPIAEPGICMRDEARRRMRCDALPYYSKDPAVLAYKEALGGKVHVSFDDFDNLDKVYVFEPEDVIFSLKRVAGETDEVRVKQITDSDSKYKKLKHLFKRNPHYYKNISKFWHVNSEVYQERIDLMMKDIRPNTKGLPRIFQVTIQTAPDSYPIKKVASEIHQRMNS
ncbi:MAG: hypothetical protein GOV00_03035 [Candidatus Altiarchaeota archaeon]|nr:hypothetical protein [Candidatus Altiarchaeota archaeon]